MYLYLFIKILNSNSIHSQMCKEAFYIAYLPPKENNSYLWLAATSCYYHAMCIVAVFMWLALSANMH